MGVLGQQGGRGSGAGPAKMLQSGLLFWLPPLSLAFCLAEPPPPLLSFSRDLPGSGSRPLSPARQPGHSVLCVQDLLWARRPPSMPFFLSFNLSSGSASSCCKGPESTYFQLCGPHSLCRCCLTSLLRPHAAIGRQHKSTRGCVPTELYLQKGVIGGIWSKGYSLSITDFS